jgi:hypothetical protein
MAGMLLVGILIYLSMTFLEHYYIEGEGLITKHTIADAVTESIDLFAE